MNIYLAFALISTFVTGWPHRAATAVSTGVQQSSSADATKDGVRPSPYPIEITQPLDSRRLKPGDEVRGLLERDAQQDGKVIAPARAVIVGHITEVRLSSRDGAQSRLQISFDRIVIRTSKARGGQPEGEREIPLPRPTIIQALAPDKKELSRKVFAFPGYSPVESIDPAPPDSLEPAIASESRVSGARVLKPTARGVIYLKGLTLEASPTGTVIIGKKTDVKLGYGTQMLLGVAPRAKK